MIHALMLIELHLSNTTVFIKEFGDLNSFALLPSKAEVKMKWNPVYYNDFVLCKWEGFWTSDKYTNDAPATTWKFLEVLKTKAYGQIV